MSEPRSANRAQQDIEQLVVGAREDMKGAQVSFLLSQAVAKLLREAARAEDCDKFMRLVDDSLKDLTKVATILADLRGHMAKIEDQRVQAERFGGDWWRRQQRRIEDAFKDGPAQGRQLWMRTYVELLVAWRLDLCAELVVHRWPFAAQDDVPVLFRAGTDALQSDRRAEALPMLEYLVGPAGKATGLPDTDLAAVLTLIGRIHLYVIADVVSAIRSFESAMQLAPSAGLPRAALGAAYHKTQEQQSARRRFMEAIKLSPDEPDGYIGMALVCEDTRSWSRARQWYDSAVKATGGRVAFDRLLAPTSGGLYWQLARYYRDNTDWVAAAEALNRAIDGGVQGKGDYPERKAYEELAEIYTRLGDREAEAAESFYEAGRRYSWRSEDKRAVELFDRSLKLVPDDPLALWHLAESLRTLSYRPEPPYIDEVGRQQILRSMEAWTRAAQLASPDPEWAWVYVSRGLINDQLEKLDADWQRLRSEAAVYLERALVLDPTIVEGWAALGRQHRLLGNPEAAHHALTRALALDPSNVGALENHAAALADLGKWEDAEKVLAQRLEIADDPWTRSVRSYVLMSSGRPVQALEEINRAIDMEPTIPGHRAGRARCYEYLGEDSQARLEHAWVADNADLSTPVLWPPTMVGWAAYRLGRLDEAVRLYERARADGTVETSFFHADLGQFYLARGEVDRGEAELRVGIGQARHDHELNVIEFDIAMLERSDFRARSVEVDEALARVRSSLGERRLAPSGDRGDARQELGDALASAERLRPRSHPEWMAVTAALARLECDAGGWSAAAQHYRTLVDTEGFSEGRLGLTSALRGACGELDELMRREAVSDAVDGYETLIQVAGGALEETELLLGLHVRAALGAVELGHFDIAHTHLTQAPRTDEQPIGDVIAIVARSLISDPRRYWALDEQLATLVHRTPGDSICPDIEAARRSAGVFFDEYWRLGATHQDTGLLSLVVPVGLEVGRHLEPTDLKEPLERLFEEMRQRIREGSGITVPAVNIGFSDELGDSEYVVKLDEVVVDRGRVCPGMVYVEGDTGVPEDVGSSFDGVGCRSPWSGRAGRWVAASPAADGPVGPEVDAVTFVAHHVETVLRRNLPNFLGVEEVSFWVEEWALTASPQMVARVASEPVALVLLTRVLRTLTRELVPIRDADAILRALVESWPGTVELLALTRVVRLRLRASLPGQDRRRLPVPPWLVAELERHVRGTDDRKWSAIPREAALNLLDRVSDWLRDEGVDLADVALVCSPAHLRPFVGRFLSIRFPMVAVLSEEELVERQEGPMDPKGAVVGKEVEGADH